MTRGYETVEVECGSRRKRAKDFRKLSTACATLSEKVDLSRLGGRIFFERKLVLADVKFDLSSEEWPTSREELHARRAKA